MVTEDRGLPEELHEAGQIQCVVLIRLEQAIIYLRCDLLKFVLRQHRVIHIVLSVQPDQICHRDQLLI